MKFRLAILAVSWMLVVAACSQTKGRSTSTTSTQVDAQCSTFLPRMKVDAFGTDDSSGILALTASRDYPDVMWILSQDSSGEVELLAVSSDGDRLAGVSLQGFELDGSHLALDPRPESGHDYLYVSGLRSDSDEGNSVELLRIREPNPSFPDASVEAEVLELVYPDRGRSVHGILVDPVTGKLLVIADDVDHSIVFDAPSPLLAGQPNALEAIATFNLPSRSSVFGADLSHDGSVIAIQARGSVLLWPRSEGMAVAETLVKPPCEVLLRDSELHSAVGLTPDGEGLLVIGGTSGQSAYLHVIPSDLPAALDDADAPNIPANLAPSMTILEPPAFSEWRAGDPLVLQGAATDDQPISEADFSWELVLSRCEVSGDCVRESLDIFNGNVAEILFPRLGSSLDGDLEIAVNYVDAEGLAGRATVSVIPVTTTVALTSEPSGALLSFGPSTGATPLLLEVLVGDKLQLEVESVQLIDSIEYFFRRWSDDGERSRVVSVTGEPLAFNVELIKEGAMFRVAADNRFELFVNGNPVGSAGDWHQAREFRWGLVPGDVIAIQASNGGGPAGVLAEIQRNGNLDWSGADWSVSTTGPPGWAQPEFDDSSWDAATTYGTYGVAPWFTNVAGFPAISSAEWIWTANPGDSQAFFRYVVKG